MTPVVNDAYRLRKLLEKATGLKVYKSELIANYFNGYLSIVQEYKNETNPHITVAQGSWSIENGGEYKISLYTPTIVIKDKKVLNIRFVKDLAYKIVEALNDEFGETIGIRATRSKSAGFPCVETHSICKFQILKNTKTYRIMSKLYKLTLFGKPVLIGWFSHAGKWYHKIGIIY